MESKIAEEKASPKREMRVTRTRNQKAMRSNILEAIAQLNGGSGVLSHTNEDGVVRMKIMLKKKDLKQVIEVMNNNGGGKNFARQSSLSPTPSLSLEQRLNLMRRRHLWRASQVKVSRRSSWRPALQSIPEEL